MILMQKQKLVHAACEDKKEILLSLWYETSENLEWYHEI